MREEKLNKELERMESEYGIELRDYGFEEDMTEEECLRVVRAREVEILATIYDIEEDAAEKLRELGEVTKEMKEEFGKEDDEKYWILVAKRNWIRMELNEKFYQKEIKPLDKVSKIG